MRLLHRPFSPSPLHSKKALFRPSATFPSSTPTASVPTLKSETLRIHKLELVGPDLLQVLQVRKLVFKIFISGILRVSTHTCWILSLKADRWIYSLTDGRRHHRCTTGLSCRPVFAGIFVTLRLGGPVQRADTHKQGLRGVYG